MALRLADLDETLSRQIDAGLDRVRAAADERDTTKRTRLVLDELFG